MAEVMTGRDQQFLVDANKEAIASLSDKELFGEATSDSPPERVAVEQESPERPRDEKGRFVARQEQEQPEPEPVIQPAQEQQPEPQEKAEIPSWRLREMREERDAARREIEQERQRAWALQQQFQALQAQINQRNQQPQQPIDIFADPEAALQQRFQPLEQRLNSAEQRLILRASKAEAVAEFGKAAVAEMEDFVKQRAAAGDPQLQLLAAQMDRSDHPVGIAMEWYQRDKLARETGGDLKAYRQKLMDELLTDPDFQAKAIERARGQAQSQPQGRPNIQLPPSINKATGANIAGPDDGDGSVFSYATQGMRR